MLAGVRRSLGRLLSRVILPDSPRPADARPLAPSPPPRKLLFLSDCYTNDAIWGPFHRTMMAYLGSAVERVLAVRANAFFTEGTHRPQSETHLAHLKDAVRSFDPDLVFSINRAGIADELLAVTRPDVKVLTVFVDYYDRLPDDLHRYGPRDLIWGTGSGP